MNMPDVLLRMLGSTKWWVMIAALLALGVTGGHLRGLTMIEAVCGTVIVCTWLVCVTAVDISYSRQPKVTINPLPPTPPKSP